MAKYSTIVSADTSKYICTIHKKRDLASWEALFFAYGTWGGGTLAWSWSPNGGTNKIPMKDYLGTPITVTSDDGIRASFLTGYDVDDLIQIYATVSGATNPALTIGLYDNN